MGDNDIRSAVQRPTGPKKRASLSRMNGKNNLESEITMGKNKKKGRNASTNSTRSPPTTPPPQSTPIKSPNSSLRETESRRRAGTPGAELYPDLSNVDNDSLDIGPTCTSESSFTSSESFTQIDSSYCSSSNRSHEISTTKFTSHSKSLKLETEETDHITEKTHVPPRSSKEKNKSQLGWNLGLGILILTIVYYFGIPSLLGISEKENTLMKNEEVFNQAEFSSKIANLRKLFPSQDTEIWGDFGSGIADVKQRHHTPAIFLLLADHEETTNCLGKRVAELARSTLNGTGDVVLAPEKLENDIGKVINFMEDLMNQTKAVVITDVLSIKPEAIKAFHDVCDEYTKLVDEAVYLFIMSSGVKTKSRKLREFAEDQLRKKFSNTIIADTLEALIVRITSGSVLAIKEEKLIPCSE